MPADDFVCGLFSLHCLCGNPLNITGERDSDRIMISVQFALSFILGFASAVFIAALLSKIVWRRMMFLARKAAESEVPLSLEAAEAEFNAERAHFSEQLCQAEEALEQERQADHMRLLALNSAQERLSEADRLEKRCAGQARKIGVLEKKLAKLAELNERLKEKTKESLKLKAADLADFRRQIKLIAAQTAGFIAAEQGADSPIWRLIAADEDDDKAKKNDLAAEIAEQAKKAASRKAKPAAGERD